MNNSQAHQKIQNIGRIGYWLCNLSLIVMFVAFVYFGVTFWKEPSFPFDDELGKNIVFGVIAAISVGLGLLGIILMRKVFLQFQSGIVFSRLNSSMVRLIGIWLAIQCLVFNLSPPEPQGSLAINLRCDFLLAGIFMVCLGWAMCLANGLKTDLDLTI